MKKCLLVLAACALTTACVEHDKCYEENVYYVRNSVVETEGCGCQKVAPACGCREKSPCGCHKAVAPAPIQAPVVPVVQPKTVVVVVPAKTQPVAQEIVYPEPQKCGCKAKAKK